MPQIWPLRPQIWPLRPQIWPLRPQIWRLRSQIQPPRLQIQPLRPLTQPLRPQIQPFRPKTWPFRPQIRLSRPQIQTLRPKNWPLRPQISYQSSVMVKWIRKQKRTYDILPFWGPLGSLRRPPGVLIFCYKPVHIPLLMIGMTTTRVLQCRKVSIFSILEQFWLFLSPKGPLKGPPGVPTLC